MDQHGGDRTVHAPRQTADHLLVADLRADFGNRLLAVSAHGPVALEPGQPHEVFVEFRTLGRVVHLGVELHGVELPRHIGGDGKGSVGRGAIDLKARGDGRHVVAMAHPDLFLPALKPAVQQRQAVGGGRYIGPAELGCAMAAFDMAAQKVHHHLLAIADAKDRHAKVEHPLGRHRRAIPVDRSGTARQDHGPWRKLRQKGVVDPVVGVNLAIHVQFAQAARDQLRHLRAEVDDQKAVMLRCVCHAPP